MADARIRLLIVGDAIQERELAAARFGTAGRHVRRLVPLQHRCGAAQVVDLLQSRLERSQFGFAGHGQKLSVGFRIGQVFRSDRRSVSRIRDGDFS
jgi:hypothetical protein